MEKTLTKFIVFLVLTGCAVKPVSKNTGQPVEPPKTATATQEPVKSEPTTENAPITQPTPVAPTNGTPSARRPIPKIGLIFSGGGAKAWAHIGVLKEIEKAKWPVHAAAGFEWGAVVAAVYANNYSSNEVEWELSKVKDLGNLEEIGNSLFEKKSVSDLKIPFVCSSLNISTQAIYLLNRGQLNKLIPFCLAQPPLSKPYQQSVAEMHDISGLAQHLRATGAKKIVLINVLAQNKKSAYTDDGLSSDNILWVKSAALMAKKVPGVDDIVNINMESFGISDIDKKREIIAKGTELGYDEIKKLTAKYGL